MMNTTGIIHRRSPWIALGLTFFLLAAPEALRAEDLIDWGRDPILPRDLDAEMNGGANGANPKNHRIRLFRMTPGFLSDPVGLSDPDDPLSGPPDGPNFAAADPTTDWLQVSMGPDNPFFDLQRPGDPGGVGFYKVQTQVQLFDSASTGCAIALQAVTPSGSENKGLDDGPTVVSPALSLFHALNDGTAIQGFVGKHVNLNSDWTNHLNQSVHYGMAVQRPLLPVGPDGNSNLYVFLEALGRYRYDAAAGGGPLNVWEMLPGVHVRLAPNWWMSGGVVVPVTTPFSDRSHWQITCSFQF